MAFVLKRKETIPQAWVRLGKGCAKKALLLCKKKDLDSIHSARREIKKLKALLQLARSATDRGSRERIGKKLRKAAARLAPPRDAHVQAQTLRKLSQITNDRQIAAAFEKFQALLERRCAKELSIFQTRKKCKPVEQLLRKVPRQFKQLRFKSRRWNAIGPGLKKSYARARAGRETAQQLPTARNLHEWRTRVKNLYFHLQVLEKVTRGHRAAMLEELEELGELLGDEHDLAVLRHTILRDSIKPNLESEAAAILPLIEVNRLRLRNAAFSSSSNLFHEKPNEFCRRFHRDWKAWRKKTNKRSQRQGPSTSPKRRDSVPRRARNPLS